MAEWTDLPSGDCGELAALVAAPGDRVLLAGVNRLDVADRLLAVGAHVTCLLRGLLDAETVRGAFPGDDRLTVLAGAIDWLPDEAAFDVIVAPDGPGRLLSPDSGLLDWPAVLARLRRALATGGRLVLGVENPLGVHRLADTRVDGWLAPAEFATTCPANLAAVRTALADHHLTAIRAYGGFPSFDNPQVLADADRLSSHATDAVICGPLSRCSPPDGPALLDSVRLSLKAWRHGQGAALAAGWFVVACDRDGLSPDLPDAICRESRDGAHATYELRIADGRWHRVLLSGEATLSGWDPKRFTGTPPATPSLEDLLVSACVRQDRAEIRRLLREYAAWGNPTALDNTLPDPESGGGFTPADPTWARPADQSIAHALARFAVRLIESGAAHPWPTTLTADQLTVLLGHLAGVTVTPVKTPATPATRSRGMGLAEALTEIARLRTAVSTAYGHVTWLEEILASRERTIKQLRRKVRRRTNELRRLRGSLAVRFSRAPRRLLDRSSTRVSLPIGPQHEVRDDEETSLRKRIADLETERRALTRAARHFAQEATHDATP
ncbi:hypothetical protein J5X84_13535 [Streptosporangiaceae bacterium NEAU-GS5]|nr:hypothetical protein [Streptosporangiaceae bacterium NEAU-GS5]